VGGLLGYALDAWAGFHPWGFLAGLVLGIIAGFRNLWQDAAAMLRRMDDTNKKQDNP
ncbi:MAG: AtpZ/AtpI family protein, partial [Deltaproteobacteria bacterium]|nr:AtpZ/AtpI family protein [Deltaproteobacteria bacterium]